jgi:homoserine kinase type II
MSVFTTVSFDELASWLTQFPVGALKSFQGISAGITNSNYFVSTEQGRYVLTLFEQHSQQELPAFLQLMAFLAQAGLPCPMPVSSQSGAMVLPLNNKPASLVSCLPGSDIEQPSVVHCQQVGEFLARMHIAAQHFPQPLPDTRDQAWFIQVRDKIVKHLAAPDAALLTQVFDALQAADFSALPQSIIHADLFRDNVLMQGERIGGVIDFYYACRGHCLYDLAIAVNDWCHQHGQIDADKARALLQAYHAVRALSPAEQQAWPLMLQKAALRFWLSRLHDALFPASGELTHAKDPNYFKTILQWHLATQATTSQLLWPESGLSSSA